MGNMRSVYTEDEPEDIWWTNDNKINRSKLSEESSTCQNSIITNAVNNEDTTVRQLSDENKEKLNEFKLEFERKHEKRRQILAEKRQDMQNLREEILHLRKENEELKKASNQYLQSNSATEELVFEIQKLQKENAELRTEMKEKSRELERSEELLTKNNELRINIAEMQKELQHLNTEILDFEKERHDYNAHVVALKDVISVSKQMLQIRESQLKELKEKIQSIEESLAGREVNILSQDLRNEYERQLQNIRNLRTLYEERQRAEKREKEELTAKLEETKKDLQTEQNKNNELEERVVQLEEENSKKYDEIKSLESNFGLAKAECRQYQAELTVINQLFSEILLGFNNTQDLDIDKLTKHLEDNHDLLQNIVINEISSEISSALPKVLLDLVSQIDEQENKEESPKNAEDDKENSTREYGKLETIVEESESQTSTIHQMNSAEEIVELLPKVWRVLLELLSHQKAPTNNLTEDETDEHPCYKTVQTPKGPSLVLSVSQTFIRLKDLILEKKSLEKETNNLKQLNTHLETRLQDQEKRLEMVSSELSKTWHVVGKLQKQHQLLHTQEKILRYELAQKRKLLTTLKEELEDSRQKCQQAKEKNSDTEKLCKELRSEFASRRTTLLNDDYNSVESGYSDERCSSSDDEPGYETDVSECNQKIALNKDIEEDFDEKSTEDNIDVAESASISEEVQNRLTSEEKPAKSTTTNLCKDLEAAGGASNIINAEIEDTIADINIDGVGEHSTNEVFHSENVPQLKTDLAQSNEKTEEWTEIAEGKGDIQKPGSSQENTKRTFDEMMVAKEERLKRLEGECQQLVTKVTNTTKKSVVISNKLDDLHGVYGEGSSSSQENRNSEVPSADSEVEIRPNDNENNNQE